MKYIKAVIGVIVLVVLDQLTKLWAVSALKDKEAVSVIKGIFELQYLENRGIAFGMFQNKYLIFILFTVIILVAIAYFYVNLPNTRRLIWLRFCLVLLAAGAIGNLIDRIVNNFVVDFLYFKLINFPIFNVADCYVTVSMIILIFLVLFYYKEDEITIGKK